MAMAATIPVKTPSTPSLIPSHQKPDTSPSSISPPSSNNSGSPSSTEGVTSKPEWSSRFNLSRLFQPHRSRPENNVQPPPQPQPQPQPQENTRRQANRLSRLYSPFRPGKVFGFLKSHHHVFHRQKASKAPAAGKEPTTNSSRKRHSSRSVAPTLSRLSTRTLMRLQCPGSKQRDKNGSDSSLFNRNPGSQSTMYSDGLVRIVPMALSTASPDHYVSLPAGRVANQLHTLHSEDLSMTEFAKLAGITILPEDEDDDDGSIFSHGLAFGCNSDTEWSRQIGNMTTARSVTGTIMSNRNSRKINIWEPEFWTPAPPMVASSGLSSSSLPILSASPSARALPSRASSLPTSSNPSQAANSSTPASATLTPSPLTNEPDDVENPSAEAKKIGHGRSNSYSPPGNPPDASVELENSRTCSPSTTVAFKRPDQAPNSAQRRSFPSFKAVAIELDNKHVPGTTATKVGGSDRTTLSSSTHLEASDPSGHSATVLPPQNLAHSVALHALQPPKIRPAGSYRSNLRARTNHASRTRSPSPSPLSRQVELSDSEGVDTPQEEKDGFELREVLSNTVAPLTPPSSRNVKNCRLNLTGDTTPRSTTPTTPPTPLTPATPVTPITPTTPEMPMSQSAIPMYHHKTQSMPLLLPPQHPLDTRDLSGTVVSSPLPLPSPPSSSDSLSQPSTPRCRPSSSPCRVLTPGTKVGRFTLVQEQYTKHSDILKIQQEHQLQLPSSPRRASMGDLLHTNSWQRSRKVSAAPLDWDSTPLQATPEENVVVFQRKRNRRHLPPTHLETHEVSKAL